MEQRGNLVAAGAAWVRKGRAALTGRRQAGAGTGAPGGASPAPVQAVTVLAPPDAVRAAWEALPEDVRGLAADLDLRPAPADRGTEVRVRLADGRAGGAPVERLRGTAPRQRVREALRRLESRLECETVVTTEGQPTGRGPVRKATTRALTRRLRARGAA